MTDFISYIRQNRTLNDCIPLQFKENRTQRLALSLLLGTIAGAALHYRCACSWPRSLAWGSGAATALVAITSIKRTRAISASELQSLKKKETLNDQDKELLLRACQKPKDKIQQQEIKMIVGALSKEERESLFNEVIKLQLRNASFLETCLDIFADFDTLQTKKQWNPEDHEKLLKSYYILFLHHQAYAQKRYDQLKGVLNCLSRDEMDRFLKSVITLQAQEEVLMPCLELLSDECLQTMLKFKEAEVRTHALNLADAISKDAVAVKRPEAGLLKDLAKLRTLFIRGMHQFAVTFLKAHDFSGDENPPMDRPDAMMRLAFFYQILERPWMLAIGIMLFLSPLTTRWWVPYLGVGVVTVCALALLRSYAQYLSRQPVKLSNHFRNLTEEAKQGKIPPIAGRYEEMDIMAKCFTPLNQDSLNILLLGESGSGKSELVAAFARAIVEGRYSGLEQVQVQSVNTADLKEPGGGSGNMYVTRLQILIKDLNGAEHQNIVFADELQTLNSKTPSLFGSDLGQQFKTAIEKGRIHMIAATTLKEYLENIATDVALDRRFRPILLKPLPPEECSEVLRNILSQNYPDVTVETGALEQAMQLTAGEKSPIAQIARACRLVIEAARSAFSQRGEKEEAELRKLMQERDTAKHLLQRDLTNSQLAFNVKALNDQIRQVQAALDCNYQEMQSLRALKAQHREWQRRFTTFAHQIKELGSKNAEKELKAFFIIRELVLKGFEKIIIEREAALETKGVKVKVDINLIRATFDSQKKTKEAIEAAQAKDADDKK